MLCGCDRSREPTPASTPASTPAPTPEQVVADQPGASPGAEPHPEKVVVDYQPDSSGLGDPCSTDAPCGWDDPCMPTRCVGAKHVPSSLGCEETAPEPGDCLCWEGHCALRPSAPNPELECKSPCGLDQGAGRCTVGVRTKANKRLRDTGPFCHCDWKTSQCVFEWVEPVSCTQDTDCWVSDGSPSHPIRRPKKLRTRRFKPCRDGELAPVCRDGSCSLAAYSC